MLLYKYLLKPFLKKERLCSNTNPNLLPPKSVGEKGTLNLRRAKIRENPPYIFFFIPIYATMLKRTEKERKFYLRCIKISENSSDQTDKTTFTILNSIKKPRMIQRS